MDSIVFEHSVLLRCSAIPTQS